ncbi:MAG: AraC family transcriptional regulator, partial [Solirubrobacteraceae bacterium]
AVMADLRVVALALDGVVAFDLACAVQTFRRGPGRSGTPRGFTMQTCAVRPGCVPTPDGFDLLVPRGLDALRSADLVVAQGAFRTTHRSPRKRSTRSVRRTGAARGS